MKKKTYEILRIVTCVLSAAIVAAAIFLFIYLGWQWGLASLFLAAGLFCLTLLFKRLQEGEDEKRNPSPEKGDFITGQIKTDADDDKE